MSNIHAVADSLPQSLSHLEFLAVEIGRFNTISTTPVLDGDSLQMNSVSSLRLSTLLR